MLRVKSCFRFNTIRKRKYFNFTEINTIHYISDKIQCIINNREVHLTYYLGYKL